MVVVWRRMYAFQESDPASRPSAGILLTPEGAADLRTRGTQVDVGDAAIAAIERKETAPPPAIDR